MTRIGWINDVPPYIGGAELTQRDFKAGAPEGVEIIDCFPGEVVEGLDYYVAHNITDFIPAHFPELKRVTWYHHDLSCYIDPEVRALLHKQAKHIFCSPMHREKYGLDGECIPPFIDLQALKPPRQSKRRRKGTCSIAQWRGPTKGAGLVEKWAAENGPVDVYGPPYFAPDLDYKGELEPRQVVNKLWEYQTFVFLPIAPEPFCRTVAEAWAAGCDVITNRLVGALHYIEKEPHKMESATTDFWDAVLNA